MRRSAQAGPAREILRFMRRYPAAPAPEKSFNALALRVFRHQFERNALYRRFCLMEGASPERVKSWKQIPAMPALAFKELVLTAFPARLKKKVFKTSGTTEGADPSTSSGRGAHYFETLALYEASILPPFQKHVLGGKTYSFRFLMSPAEEVPHSSLSYMMRVVNRRFARGRGTFYIRNGEARFDRLARDLKKEKKRTLLLATAFSLKAFLDHLGPGSRLRLKAGSRLMETGGFKGRMGEVPKAALYRLCRERLGIPKRDCISEYGMTELSSQYYSAGGGVFTGPAWMRALVVDPQSGRECRPGQAGLLKHVDLANLGSVMAVQTEDLGRKKAGGFVFLGRAKGSEARGCSLSYEKFLRGSL